jgi:hypothetical protein
MTVIHSLFAEAFGFPQYERFVHGVYDLGLTGLGSAGPGTSSGRQRSPTSSSVVSKGGSFTTGSGVRWGASRGAGRVRSARARPTSESTYPLKIVSV